MLIEGIPKVNREQTPLTRPDTAPNLSKRKKMIGLFAILGITAVGLLVWRYGFHSAAPVFQLATVERGHIEASVSTAGSTNAVVTVQVGSQVSGNIKALYADFNTKVKAGQLVALIDPEIFEAKVQQADAGWRNAKSAMDNAKAGVAKAQADVAGAKAGEVSQEAAIAKAKVGVADAKTKLARRQTMFNDGIISREDLDTAQATYDQAAAEQQAAEAQRDAAVENVRAAQAALEVARKTVTMSQDSVDLSAATLDQARIDLRHTRITAPVDGTVVARRMDVGQTVAASFQAPTIFEIAQDLTKMQVDTNVAESDIGRLQVGQAATFMVDAYPGEVFPGRVKQIRQAPINVQNVITYDAVIEVANPDLKLFPGMTANVTILTQQTENAIKIPNAALRFRPSPGLLETPAAKLPPGSWATVYVPGQHSKVRPISVKTGITDGSFTEILEGDLQEGQRVVVSTTAPGAATPRPSTTSPRLGKRI